MSSRRHAATLAVSIVALGGRIRAARVAMGWTQAQFARAIGVSKSAVSQWEKGGVQNVRLGNLFAVARVLNKDIRELVFGDSGHQVADSSYAELSSQRQAMLRSYGELPEEVQANLRALIFSLARSCRIR